MAMTFQLGRAPNWVSAEAGPMMPADTIQPED